MKNTDARAKLRTAFLIISVLMFTSNLFSQTKIAEGFIDISPLTVTAGSEHTTISFIYKNGKTEWGSSAESGILKITVPAGWSAPSLNPSDPGYFTVETREGTLEAVSADGQTIIIRASGLAPRIGSIVISYGEPSFGGPGAVVQDSVGTAVFKTAAAPQGDSAVDIGKSPEISVIEALSETEVLK